MLTDEFSQLGGGMVFWCGHDEVSIYVKVIISPLSTTVYATMSKSSTLWHRILWSAVQRPDSTYRLTLAQSNQVDERRHRAQLSRR